MKNQNVKLDNIAFIGPKQFENFTKASLFEVCTLKWLQLCSFQLNRFIELAINSGTKPYEFGFEEAVLSLDSLCPGRYSWKFWCNSSQAKRAALLNYKREPSDKTLPALWRARNNAQRIARRLANDYWLNLCQNIQVSTDCGHIRAMYDG